MSDPSVVKGVSRKPGGRLQHVSTEANQYLSCCWQTGSDPQTHTTRARARSLLTGNSAHHALQNRHNNSSSVACPAVHVLWPYTRTGITRQPKRHRWDYIVTYTHNSTAGFAACFSKEKCITSICVCVGVRICVCVFVCARGIVACFFTEDCITSSDSSHSTHILRALSRSRKWCPAPLLCTHSLVAARLRPAASGFMGSKVCRERVPKFALLLFHRSCTALPKILPLRMLRCRQLPDTQHCGAQAGSEQLC